MTLDMKRPTRREHKSVTWDYRLMKPATEADIQVVETYYNAADVPVAFFTDTQVYDLTVDGVRSSIDLMARACDQPVLTPADFPHGNREPSGTIGLRVPPAREPAATPTGP